MENLMMIASISRPPSSTTTTTTLIPRKQQLDTNNNTKKPNNNPLDTHLNYLSKTGRLSKALTHLDSVTTSKISPKTYINMLQSCIELDDVNLGRKLHTKLYLVDDVNPFVLTKLLSMYAKCGSFNDARTVFDTMSERNLYTWSAMIGACTREFKWKETVELFYMMMISGELPDDFLLAKILPACTNVRDLKTGELIHSLVVRLGMVGNLRVANSILDMYAKCGKLSSARRFFDHMDKKDKVAWNTMILGYSQNGENEEASRFFDKMCDQEGVEPGLITWNILINSYNQLGRCEVALELMRQMESLGVEPDVFTWTSMISGLSQNGRTSQALNLFKEMLAVGVKPSGVTFTSAISACSSLKSLNTGLMIHSIVVKMGYLDELLVGNSLIDMYSKCGELEAARQVFDIIVEKDVYTWNSMIGGYCQAGYCGKAHELFMQMKQSGLPPTVITWNVMISGFIQNGDEDQALDLFQRMEKDGKIKRNAASWNSLISGYVHIGQKDKALWVFRQMQSLCINPNSVTILSVLPACANLIGCKKLKEVHASVLRRNLDCVLSVSNSLVDSYASSGNISYSRAMFDRLISRDIITWNSMITGYVLHGCSIAALDLFDQMVSSGFKPNRGTFLSIIHAYSIAGMVGDGNKLFYSISEDWQIIPALEHYSAMIHLYGRSGRLLEAKDFIEDMPIEPDFSVWDAFLTACRIHKNLSLAVYAAEQLLDLEPGNILIQQLISQLYALCGKYEDTSKVRKLEKEKYISQSWVEVKNSVHTFVTGDQTHPYYGLLHSWVKKMEQNVNKSDSHEIFCVEDEEKEDLVGVHSEKLALAFSFIGTSSPLRCIRIVKNMRMCKDCHRIAKYVSKTSGCEIYLNDSKCLHIFKNGECSCGDYW
ncbi:hypothetical protein ACFE04_027202 [Oxalis oulophora]